MRSAGATTTHLLVVRTSVNDDAALGDLFCKLRRVNGCGRRRRLFLCRFPCRLAEIVKEGIGEVAEYARDNLFAFLPGVSLFLLGFFLMFRFFIPGRSKSHKGCERSERKLGRIRLRAFFGL